MRLLALTLLLSGSTPPVEHHRALHGPMMLDLRTALAEHSTPAWFEVTVNEALVELVVPVEREAAVGPLGRGGFHLAMLTLAEGDIVTVTLADTSGPIIDCALDVDAGVLHLASVTRACLSSRPAVLSFILYPLSPEGR